MSRSCEHQSIKRVISRWTRDVQQPGGDGVLPWDGLIPSVHWLSTFFNFLSDVDTPDAVLAEFGAYCLIPVTGIRNGTRFTGLGQCARASDVVKMPTNLRGLSGEAYRILTGIGLLTLWNPSDTSASGTLAEAFPFPLMHAGGVSEFTPHAAIRILHSTASVDWGSLGRGDVHCLLRFFSMADLVADDLQSLRCVLPCLSLSALPTLFTMFVECRRPNWITNIHSIYTPGTFPSLRSTRKHARRTSPRLYSSTASSTRGHSHQASLEATCQAVTLYSS